MAGPRPFVLSVATARCWSMRLHLLGYESVSLDQIKKFRQLGS
jgi:hypothetical protein